MDDSLHRWCLNSLATAQEFTPRKQQPGRSAGAFDAEQSVDAAAFHCLAKSRGITVDQSHHSDEIRQQLEETCPLTRDDSIEALIEVHELLVAQRGLKKQRGKSQSRKANGIFYTPQHVINYIVQSTVLPRAKTLTPVNAHLLTILDPAVGCGGFLLCAFRLLLDAYRNWYQSHQPELWPQDIAKTPRGWRLTSERCRAILLNHLFGTDLDAGAIVVAQRVLWLTLVEESEATEWSSLDSNLKPGHALIGPAFGQVRFDFTGNDDSRSFCWDEQFPQIARRNGFDVVIGNPPYRRERDFKQELYEIAQTPLVRFRAPRMDLWYYFVHRGIELLRPGGSLSFITNAYWVRGTGAEKLRKTLSQDVHLDELFLLQNQPLFDGVSGRHTIFRLTHSMSDQPTTIKIAPRAESLEGQAFVTGQTRVLTLTKSKTDLFDGRRLNIQPSADTLFEKLEQHLRLKEFGLIRQGIAENPATINRRTIERFPDSAFENHWKLHEGVFSLTPDEVEHLQLSANEANLLCRYHDLCDLGRYWIASQPSRRLIYSTKDSCPSIEEFPRIRDHLQRFRTILDARRETARGSNQWWQLHWPRDERLWTAPKLVAIQMAARPSFAPAFKPLYTSFSTNVFVPSMTTREDLRYFCGLLNSQILWAWFEHYGKHRGVGIEINGHVLAQAPIRKIDFSNPNDVHQHKTLLELVAQRLTLQKQLQENEAASSVRNPTELINEIARVETLLEATVAALYGLNADDLESVHQITSDRSPDDDQVAP